jgi:hypothetical protein
VQDSDAVARTEIGALGSSRYCGRCARDPGDDGAYGKAPGEVPLHAGPPATGQVDGMHQRQAARSHWFHEVDQRCDLPGDHLRATDCLAAQDHWDGVIDPREHVGHEDVTGVKLVPGPPEPAPRLGDPEVGGELPGRCTLDEPRPGEPSRPLHGHPEVGLP